MNLKDRLGRLTSEPERPVKADPKQERLSELRRKIEEVMNRRERLVPVHTPWIKPGAVPLERVVTGEEVAAGDGRFFFSRSSMKAEDFHGHLRVCDLACTDMEAAALLAGSPMLKDLSIEDGLFLDTETTGLAGGTGTFPFLIGLGWFEQDCFVTCQLFARDFSEEGAMLAMLQELASSKRFLVTFNGKAYDLNLLSARFILNRTEDVLSIMPHIDLLHPSRRIFSHRIENARLVTIEACVLGVMREDDVPGYDIPRRYFDWLKQPDGRIMGDVFRHNRLDIISMASLLKHLTDLIKGGCDLVHVHPGDLLSAARLHHDHGDLDEAMRILEPLARSGQTEVARSAQRSLSLIHKKIGRWGEAVSIWQGIIKHDACDVFAAEELAKWYEHHTRNFGLAAEIVQRVLDRRQDLSDSERRSMEHRMRRLFYKMAPR